MLAYIPYMDPMGYISPAELCDARFAARTAWSTRSRVIPMSSVPFQGAWRWHRRKDS